MEAIKIYFTIQAPLINILQTHYFVSANTFRRFYEIINLKWIKKGGKIWWGG